MAWNEPGNNDKDPWGKRGNDSPPDLDDVIRNLQQKLAAYLVVVNHPIIMIRQIMVAQSQLD